MKKMLNFDPKLLKGKSSEFSEKIRRRTAGEPLTPEEEKERLNDRKLWLKDGCEEFKEINETLSDAFEDKKIALEKLMDTYSLILGTENLKNQWILEQLRDGIVDKRGFKKFLQTYQETLDREKSLFSGCREEIKKLDRKIEYFLDHKDYVTETRDSRLKGLFNHLQEETKEEKKVLDAVDAELVKREQDSKELAKDGYLRMRRFDGFNRKLIEEMRDEY